MQTATYFQAQQSQQQVQDAQGPAAAVESYVTQALGQLQAQQGLPVTQMGEQIPPKFSMHWLSLRGAHPRTFCSDFLSRYA